MNTEHKAINAMPDGPDRDAARKALNERGNRLAYEAVRSELLRATYSPDQLEEEMVWFWLNHFSVHQAEGESALAGRRLCRSGDPSARTWPVQGPRARNARAPGDACLSG